MGMKIHYSVLDAKRAKLLPALSSLKDAFYLAGGTGLALQLGHRVSVHFDFFTERHFDSVRLFQDCERILKAFDLEMVQNEEDTLSIIVDKNIKISFLTFPYPVVLPLVKTRHLLLAHPAEIGSMTIAALLRATYRDYVDLYFLLRRFSLAHIFEIARKKFRNFDEGIYLKCLLAYDAVEMSPVRFTKGFAVTPHEVFSFIERKTEEYLAAMKHLGSAGMQRCLQLHAGHELCNVKYPRIGRRVMTIQFHHCSDQRTP